MMEEEEKLPIPPPFNDSIYRAYDLRALNEWPAKRMQKLLRLGNGVHASFNQLAWLTEQPLGLLAAHAEPIMDWYRDHDMRALLDCNWHRTNSKIMAGQLKGKPGET